VGIHLGMAIRSPRAVLFDRDGTLVRDVPYNADPALVEPMPTVREALAVLRERDIAIGVVTNQSGVARGLVTPEELAAVNARVDELLGPFDIWAVCPHGSDEGCGCRKPAPGLVIDAARALGVHPADVVVIGDIGADVAAAAAAGSRAVLVPTSLTLREEVDGAPVVAATVLAAVGLALALEPTPGAAS
jgi:D-glycero-D-manno-heptose 1,7-bisphosphate phosphatase